MHMEIRRRGGIMTKLICSCCSLFLILLGNGNFVLASQRRQQPPTTNASTNRHLRRKTEEEATVWDRIQQNTDLSTFATAITVAEMEDTFGFIAPADDDEDEDSQQSPTEIVFAQPLTVVFAPTNEAFEKLGTEYVNKLLDPTFRYVC